MLDRDCLVFVEVRYRSAGGYLSAAASVDGIKQRKLALAASFFLCRRQQFADLPVRFDVVAIDESNGKTPRLEWIKDAFRPGL